MIVISQKSYEMYQDRQKQRQADTKIDRDRDWNREKHFSFLKFENFYLNCSIQFVHFTLYTENDSHWTLQHTRILLLRYHQEEAEVAQLFSHKCSVIDQRESSAINDFYDVTALISVSKCMSHLLVNFHMLENEIFSFTGFSLYIYSKRYIWKHLWV